MWRDSLKEVRALSDLRKVESISNEVYESLIGMIVGQYLHYRTLRYNSVFEKKLGAVGRLIQKEAHHSIP